MFPCLIFYLRKSGFESIIPFKIKPNYKEIHDGKEDLLFYVSLSVSKLHWKNYIGKTILES